MSRGDRPLRNDFILLDRKEVGLEIKEGPAGLGSRGGAEFEAPAGNCLTLETTTRGSAEPAARISVFTVGLISGLREFFPGCFGLGLLD